MAKRGPVKSSAKSLELVEVAGTYAEHPANPVSVRRRYDSPIRRKRTAETKDRIVSAGADLASQASGWDWDELTFRSVAAHAGVSERTAYRHFPTESDLHDAIWARLQQQGGMSFDGLSIEEIFTLASSVFSPAPEHGRSTSSTQEMTSVNSDRHRQEAIHRAVARATSDWSARDQRLVAAVLDVLCSLSSYRRLTSKWRMSSDEAVEATEWVVGLVMDSVGAGRAPTGPHVGRLLDGPAVGR